MRCLELYCGIGGFAVAAQQLDWQVVRAIDINQHAAKVYRHNFDHLLETRTIESLSTSDLRLAEADLWWMSPPCQPFTARGRQRDIQDARTESFLNLLDRVAEITPPMLAMENVGGFASSRAAEKLRQVLWKSSYQWRELELCPTDSGIPNRRRRVYLVASRLTAPAEVVLPNDGFRISEMLDTDPHTDLLMGNGFATAYGTAIHTVQADDPHALTACFTSAYGKSPVRSGSYLYSDGQLRRFSPEEILRIFGFPTWYRIPVDVKRRTAWKLVGNSLSIPIVTGVLRSLGPSVRKLAA